jgi:hypothetical protein
MISRGHQCIDKPEKLSEFLNEVFSHFQIRGHLTDEAISVTCSPSTRIEELYHQRNKGHNISDLET